MSTNTQQFQSTAQDLREGINVMIEDSKTRIMETADKIEEQYIAPLTKQTKSFASRNPVLSLFLASFVVFSLVPVLTFLAFVFIASGFVVGLALAVVFFSVTGIIFFAGVILFPFMIFATFLALSTTTTLLTLFSLHRLYTCFRASDSNLAAAFPKWVHEMKQHAGLVEVTEVLVVVEEAGEGVMVEKVDVKEEEGQLVGYVDEKVGMEDEGSDEGVIVSPKNEKSQLE